MARRASFLILLFFVAGAPLRGQSPRPMSASDIREAMDRLATVGSILYIAAHPDDENTAFLASMVHGRNIRAGYLSITRGEGGQNLIGSEQGDLLGMIRTQELLAARSIDGGEQFFTRAIDFGYSKTAEETLRLWGKEEIVSDIVRVIRSYRPDVVVTRFTPELGGHGNHTASAGLALEAVRSAGDASRFPDQLLTLAPWSPKRLVWNAFRQGGGAAGGSGLTEDLGAYDPVIGRSYTELAGEARTMHKSQGFGAAQNRASAVNSFQHVWGDSARLDLFEGIDLTWRRLTGGERVQTLVDSLRVTFDDRDPSKSIDRLSEIRSAIAGLPDDPWKRRKLAETEDLIIACAGLWIDALAPRAAIVALDSLSVTLTAVNRSAVPVRILSWSLNTPEIASEDTMQLEPLVQRTSTLSGRLPKTAVITQPYWLAAPHEAFRYVVPDPEMLGRAEGDPAFTATVDIKIGGMTIRRTVPVRHRRVDPVDGEVYRPAFVTTPAHVSFDHPVHVFTATAPRILTVNVAAVREITGAAVQLELPTGWIATPAVGSLDRMSAGERRSFAFEVRPSPAAKTGTARAIVDVEGGTIDIGIKEAVYDHIPHQVLHIPATTRLLSVPLKVKAGIVGYVMGAGDEVAEGLRRIGCRVEELTDEALSSGDLRFFDALVVGVRAYNTRPTLRALRNRLERYVRDGGTVVVQYQTTARGESDDFAPVPLVIGRERVTEEDAPMRILEPHHRVMTHPNRIAEADFAGWIQERGLYYASTWDTVFVPILSANDSGEPPRNGGLIVARIGKGYFVYTGLSLFRQIPAGVPGAYRLLANLVSLGRS
jgi:LmbE family N-acetylglucosaminyl deacetylase